MTTTEHERELARAHTAQIVTGYVSNNAVLPETLTQIIKSVFTTMSALGATDAGAPGGPHKPAVPVKRSVTPEYIVCLEDGKKLKMLKRYLHTQFGLSPEQYRLKWNLPREYPMVAPAYAAKRSALAKKIGLGTARTKSGFKGKAR